MLGSDQASGGGAVENTGRQSAIERVAQYLCELSVESKATATGELRFEMPLTMTRMGDALGLTPIHVLLSMRRLSAAGLVSIAGRSVTILDLAALWGLAKYKTSSSH